MSNYQSNSHTHIRSRWSGAIRGALFAVLLTLGTPVASSAEISLAQSVDRLSVAYEDQVTFEITLTWNGPTLAYIFDRPFRVEADKLKVSSFSSSLASTGTGSDEVTTKKFTYQLRPVTSGSAIISSIKVEYLTWPDSTMGHVLTDPVRIHIAAPVPVEIVDEETGVGLWVLIGGLVIALFVTAGVWIRRKPETVVSLRPSEEFIARLDLLYKTSGSDLKQFQRGLYKELGRYLQAEFNLEIVGKEVANIKVMIESTSLNAQQQSKLLVWIERAEREKYSPVEPAPGETLRLSSELRSFFEKL